MSALIILLLTFFLLWLLNTYALKSFLSLTMIGRLAIAVLLLFTGASHFTKQSEMVQMMPEFLPYKIELVYLTGLMELAFAIGLIWQRSSKWTAIVLIIFFCLILPANVIGSLKRVHLGGMENGLAYLYFRVPLQFFFMGWVYYFGIRLPQSAREKMTAINKA